MHSRSSPFQRTHLHPHQRGTKVVTWSLAQLALAALVVMHVLLGTSALLKLTPRLVSTATAGAVPKGTMAREAATEQKPRLVLRKLLSKKMGEGDGVTVRRSIGRPEMKTLDPFLLLDEADVRPPAGFPQHPHRGFETVSYMLKGTMTHEDFEGHEGLLEEGDLQWMTAGKGILHSELPTGDGGHGLQLWVNLPAKEKMCAPAYQELKSKDIPKVQKDGVMVAVIAGESLGVTSPVYTRTPTMYLDVTMQPGSALINQKIPEGWNAFAYTLEGETIFGNESSESVGAHYTCELSKGSTVSIWNKSGSQSRFVLIAGQPLGEPVAQYGPFVMNTQEELKQAMRDFQLCRNGFEKAMDWQPKNERQRAQRTH